MGQGNIGLRFNVDVSQANTQVKTLSDTVVDLRAQIAKAKEASDWKEVAILTQAMMNATSARGQIMQQANQVNNPLIRQGIQGGNVFQGQAAWMLQQSLNQIATGIIKSMDAALSAAKQRASGDYTGAHITEKRTRGEVWGQGIGSAVGLLGFLGGPMLGALTVGLGSQIGQFIGGIGTHKLEADLAYSQQYKNAFASIDALNQNFGGAINRKSAEENNQHGLRMYGRASNAAAGTGMSTDEFISAMKQTAIYGVRNETQALNMVQTQALWSRFTGADLTAIQKQAGMAYRFGGETNATSIAYGGLMSQNMGKGQFGEFLNSIARIMEEGIAKGFTRSSEEIAGNMTMLYRLSGNSAMWQGEQGAQRLSQMNAAVANATNLQSVEDVISFGVVRDLLGSGDNRMAEFRRLTKAADDRYYTGTYIDEMQLLERGVSRDLLRGQFDAVDRLEGDNNAAKIERYKTMYGLNYTGATQVWAMSQRIGEAGYSEADIESKIKDMQTNPRYQSDSQKMQDTLNSMNTQLVNIGKFKIEREFGIMREAYTKISGYLDTLIGEGHGRTTDGRLIISTARSDQVTTQADLNQLYTDANASGNWERMQQIGRDVRASLEGGEHRATLPNGRQAETNLMIASSMVSNKVNQLLNEFTHESSHGGRDVTDREMERFIREIRELTESINRGHRSIMNRAGERITDVRATFDFSGL